MQAMRRLFVGLKQFQTEVERVCYITIIQKFKVISTQFNLVLQIKLTSILIIILMLISILNQCKRFIMINIVICFSSRFNKDARTKS